VGRKGEARQSTAKEARYVPMRALGKQVLIKGELARGNNRGAITLKR